ncbi:MAG: zinc-binding dehydrogenase [Firmicutes bacterium]|nr:zinc-binding dehydrogenase [Bacillota bacterium]
MKAVLFRTYGGPEVLEYADVAEPEVGPNEVLLQVKATSANYNDIWARRGHPVQQPLPHISGSDAAGVVVAVGTEVKHIQKGDEVMVYPARSCGVCAACSRGENYFCREFKLWGFDSGPLDGGHAEFVRIHEAQAVRKPKTLTWEQAASLPLVLVTAWRMLITKARIRAGQTVLIWGGAGGLGTLAIQICRVMGAVPIAVVSTDHKAQLATELGAAAVINRRSHDIATEVRRLTDRQGVDVVFEHTGEQTWPTSVKSLKRGGTLVVCGATSGFNGNTDIRYLWNKQQNYLGSHLGIRSELEDALAFVASGAIRPVIDRVLSLKDVAEAQMAMEQGEVSGKIVFIP